MRMTMSSCRWRRFLYRKSLSCSSAVRYLTQNPWQRGCWPSPIWSNSLAKPMLILIAGPYRSGTGDDPEKIAANVRLMESFTLPIFRLGHIPLLGEWLALPLVHLAGSQQIGDAAFNEIFHPIAERLLEKCDAVLRVGGASQGADLMVEVGRKRGLQVYTRLADIPSVH